MPGPNYRLTTVIAAAATRDLTMLRTIKSVLGLTDSKEDDSLKRDITGLSAAVENFCNRSFALETVQDLFRPQRGYFGSGLLGEKNPLQLARWPVTQVLSVSTEATNTARANASTATAAGSAVVNFASVPGSVTLGMTVRNLNSPGVIPNGTTLLSIAGTALTLSANATGAGIASGDMIDFSTTLIEGTDFEIDHDNGQLYRLNSQGNQTTWSAVRTLVVYLGGYVLPGQSSPATPPPPTFYLFPGTTTPAAIAPPTVTLEKLPADIERAIIRLVTGGFDSRQIDPRIREEDVAGIGRTVYWEPKLDVGAFPPEVSDLLDNFRVPLFA